MMLWIFLGLALIFIGAGAYLILQPPQNIQNPADNFEDPAELNLDSEEVPMQNSIQRPLQTVEFEVHPFEALGSMGTRLQSYATKASTTILDPEELRLFQSSLSKCLQTLESMDSKWLIQELSSFMPSQVTYHFNIDIELQALTEEILQQTYNLGSQPEGIHLIERKIRTLNAFREDLLMLIQKYKELNPSALSPQEMKQMIHNDVNILSDPELFTMESLGFINFYFSLQSYLLLNRVYQISLEDIQSQCSHLQRLFEEAKNSLTDTKIREFRKIQKPLLEKLRNYFTHFHRLYDGIHIGLEKLKESTFKDVSVNLDHIEEIMQDIQENLLPVAEAFAQGHGKSEIEYQKHMKNATTKPGTLTIGQSQSASSFFSQKSKDARDLLNSRAVTELLSFLQPILQTIQNPKAKT